MEVRKTLGLTLSIASSTLNYYQVPISNIDLGGEVKEAVSHLTLISAHPKTQIELIVIHLPKYSK